MAIDWKAVRKDYESSGLTFGELSKKYGCRPGTIERRAREDGWKKGRAGKRRAGGRKKAVNASVDLKDDHLSLWIGVRKRLIEGLKNSDAKQGLEELKVAKMAGEVLSSVIRGERLVRGMEAGGPDAMEEADEIAREMASLTVPPGAEPPLDGD